MAACEPEDMDPTWGPLEDEDDKTPHKPDGDYELQRAETKARSCPLNQSQHESQWWCPALSTAPWWPSHTLSIPVIRVPPEPAPYSPGLR